MNSLTQDNKTKHMQLSLLFKRTGQALAGAVVCLAATKFIAICYDMKTLNARAEAKAVMQALAKKTVRHIRYTEQATNDFLGVPVQLGGTVTIQILNCAELKCPPGALAYKKSNSDVLIATQDRHGVIAIKPASAQFSLRVASLANSGPL